MFDWATPSKGPGFGCDVCGGAHKSTFSCKGCGAWVCEKHAEVERKLQEYAPPIVTAYCKECHGLQTAKA